MSDVQQGPGWWVASDGKWYPPESHPQARAAALPPPPTSTPPGGAGPAPFVGAPMSSPPPHHQGYATPTRRSVSSGLGGTIQGFSWAVAGFSLLAAVMAIAALASFNTYWDTAINSRAEDRAFDDWVTYDDGLGGTAGLAALAGFVLWILLVIWMNSAHKTTQQLWNGDRHWSSGWTVGAWFIPVANAILPRLVLGEIEKIAFAPRSNGVLADASWKQRATLAIGKLWWIGLVAGMVLNAVGNALGGSELASAGEIRAGYVFNAVGFALLAPSGVLGALYVRRLGARLSDEGLRQEP